MTEFDTKRITTAVFDLDATVIMYGKMSERVRQDLLALKRAGIKTAINTGRDYSMIRPQIRDVFDYSIADNGAVVVENASGREIFSKRVDNMDAAKIVRVFQNKGADAFCFMGSTVMGTPKAFYLMRQILPPEEHEAYRFMPGNDPDLTIRINSPLYLEKHKQGPCKIQALFKDLVKRDEAADEIAYLGLEMLRLRNGEIEITAKGTGKEIGMRALDSADRIIAFGDSKNDLSMIKDAYIGVAMGNGSDEVKKSADIIAPSVLDDGVAEVLEALFGVKPD